MKIQFEQEDIENIAKAVAEKLTPMIKEIQMKNEFSSNTMFDVIELAKYLNVKKDWIYQRVYMGELPHAKLGGLLRFKKADIDK